MTDKELLDIIANGGQVSVPYFDGAMLKVEKENVRYSANELLSPSELLPSLKNFLALSPNNRRSDSRHLFAFYKQTIQDHGEEDVVERMNGVRPTLETIWNHTRIGKIFFSDFDAEKYVAKRTFYLMLSGGVDWEQEHGLVMSWLEGRRLVKVDAFDDHPAHYYPLGTPESERFVFQGLPPELSTLPDPK